MYLKKGCEEEYEKRHRALWPEVKAKLKESGVYDYSIYLEKETGTLFAFQKVEGESGSWDYMKDIMYTNADNSPVSIPLKEVFHLD